MLLAGFLLASCSTSGTTGPGVETPRLLNRPRSPGPPSVFPEAYPQPIKGYVKPKLRVSARLYPNTGLRVGSRVTIDLKITNLGPTRKDQLGSFIFPNSEAAWDLIQTPKGSRNPGRMCLERGEGFNTICGVGSINVPFAINKGETKVLRLVARLREFRCPGKGDFIGEAFAVVTRGSLVGPTYFRILTWMENDPDDYLRDLTAGPGTPSPAPSNCEPQSIPD